MLSSKDVDVGEESHVDHFKVPNDEVHSRGLTFYNFVVRFFIALDYMGSRDLLDS